MRSAEFQAVQSIESDYNAIVKMDVSSNYLLAGGGNCMPKAEFIVLFRNYIVWLGIGGRVGCLRITDYEFRIVKDTKHTRKCTEILFITGMVPESSGQMAASREVRKFALGSITFLAIATSDELQWWRYADGSMAVTTITICVTW